MATSRQLYRGSSVSDTLFMYTLGTKPVDMIVDTTPFTLLHPATNTLLSPLRCITMSVVYAVLSLVCMTTRIVVCIMYFMTIVLPEVLL